MMKLPTTYGEYGNAQEAFDHLFPESQAEIVEYCHGVALMMHEAREAAPGVDDRYVALGIDSDGEIVAERTVRADADRESAEAYARLMPTAYADRGAVSWALWTVGTLRDYRLRIAQQRAAQAARTEAAAGDVAGEWVPVPVWYFLPNTNTRVTGLMLGFAPGRRDVARVRRDDDGKVYRVPASVLRR